MKTVKINVYLFRELSVDVQSLLVERFKDKEEYINLILFREDCERMLNQSGFEEAVIRYSLSDSQGDGLSFSAKYYTKLEELYLKILGKGKEKTSKILADNTMESIEGNTGRYCFASRSNINLYIEEDMTNKDNIGNVVYKVQESLRSLYMDLCTKYEKAGYEEIEFQSSNEYIFEELERDNYLYTIDGKLFE